MVIEEMLTLEEHNEREENSAWLHPFEDNRLDIQMEIIGEYAALEARATWFDTDHLILCRRLAGGN